MVGTGRGHIPQECYDYLFENASDGVLFCDADGHVVAANPAACAMFGCTKAEIGTLGAMELTAVSDENHENLTFLLREQRDRGWGSHELSLRRADGSWFSALATTALLRNPAEGIASLWVLRDLSTTNLLQAEKRQLHNLNMTVARVSAELSHFTDEASFLEHICVVLVGVEEVQVAWIGMNTGEYLVEPVAAAGIDIGKLDIFKVRRNTEHVKYWPTSKAMLEGTIQYISNADAVPQLSPWRLELRSIGMMSLVSAPIILGKEVIGTVNVWSNKSNAFDTNSTNLIKEVAEDISIGINSLRLSENLSNALTKLRKALQSTVESITKLVEVRDPYTAGHERRVAHLAEQIGKELGLPTEQITGLRIIGFIHDIGKIGVPSEILSKPTRLDEAEFALIKRHSQTGYDVLKSVEFPWPVAQAILQHHERMNGSGYPQGIKGEAIVLEARILAVADVVEAMASHRPYRPGFGIDIALSEIERGRGKLYDAQVADACLNLFRNKGYQLPSAPVADPSRTTAVG